MYLVIYISKIYILGISLRNETIAMPQLNINIKISLRHEIVAMASTRYH